MRALSPCHRIPPLHNAEDHERGTQKCWLPRDGASRGEAGDENRGRKRCYRRGSRQTGRCRERIRR